MKKNKRAKKEKWPPPQKNVVDIEKSSSQKVAHMVAWLVKHRKNRKPPISLKKSLEVGQGGTSKIFLSQFSKISVPRGSPDFSKHYGLFKPINKGVPGGPRGGPGGPMGVQ